MNKTKRIKNLKPKPWSRKKCSEMGKIGGKRSGETKRRKKLFRELAEGMLAQKAPEKIREKIKSIFPEISEKDLTAKTALLVSVYKKALNGDLEAFKTLRDTIGEKPVEKIQSENVNVNTSLEQAKDMADELNRLLARQE